MKSIDSSETRNNAGLYKSQSKNDEGEGVPESCYFCEDTRMCGNLYSSCLEVLDLFKFLSNDIHILTCRCCNITFWSDYGKKCS